MLTNLDNNQIKSFMDSGKELDFETKEEACEIIQKLLSEISEKDKVIDSYKLRTEIDEFLISVDNEEELIEMVYNDEITDLEDIKCIRLNAMSLIEDGMNLCSRLVSVDDADILENIEDSVFTLKTVSLPTIQLVEKRHEASLEYDDQEIEME